QWEWYNLYSGSAGLNSDQGNIVLYNRTDNVAPFTVRNPTVDAVFNINGGSVGIGTTTPTEKLHVAGNITVTGNINAKYQDIAEWVSTSRPLMPGTVVILDPDRINAVV